MVLFSCIDDVETQRIVTMPVEVSLCVACCTFQWFNVREFMALLFALRVSGWTSSSVDARRSQLPGAQDHFVIVARSAESAAIAREARAESSCMAWNGATISAVAPWPHGE